MDVCSGDAPGENFQLSSTGVNNEPISSASTWPTNTLMKTPITCQLFLVILTEAATAEVIVDQEFKLPENTGINYMIDYPGDYLAKTYGTEHTGLLAGVGVQASVTAEGSSSTISTSASHGSTRTGIRCPTKCWPLGVSRLTSCPRRALSQSGDDHGRGPVELAGAGDGWRSIGDSF